MKRYEAYDSFLDIWVNEIPAHWETHKMKYLFHERSEKGYPDEPLLVASHTIFLLKTRQMCYTVSGDENEEIRDNH